MTKLENLEKDLAEVLNKYSVDNECRTPDFILAKFLVMCIFGYQIAKIETIVWETEK